MKATTAMKTLPLALVAGALLAGPAAAETRLPPVERMTLENGLEVILIPSDLNPYLEVRFLVRAGAASDPAGKEGLASLMAGMLTSGTSSRSEQQISQALEEMGASLSASADTSTTEVFGSVITLEPEVPGRFLELFADVVRDATFPDNVLQRVRTLREAALKRLKDDHRSLADLALEAALYGPTDPRGRLSYGGPGTIKKLTRDDALMMRDRLLVPQHGVLAIAGHFDPAQVKAWLKTGLGDPTWGAGVCEAGELEGTCAKLCKEGRCLANPLAAKTLARADYTPPKVLLVDRDDPSMSQIQWRYGQLNPVRLLDEDWGPFRLGAQILGGDFTGRLNTVLRVKEGLTYGARFNVNYGAHHRGKMTVWTFTKPKDVERAVQLAQAEIDKVLAAPLPEAEIQSFKNKINNGFPFKFETVVDTLEQYLYLAARGVPTRWLATYTDKIAAPSAAQVHAALKAHIDPKGFTLVAVGNKDLIPTLQKFGPVTVVAVDDLIDSGLKKATVAR